MEILTQSIEHRKPGDFPALADLNPGDVLVADGGFTCLREGEVATVEKDGGGLFVRCCAHDEGDYGKPMNKAELKRRAKRQNLLRAALEHMAQAPIKEAEETPLSVTQELIRDGLARYDYTRAWSDGRYHYREVVLTDAGRAALNNWGRTMKSTEMPAPDAVLGYPDGSIGMAMFHYAHEGARFDYIAHEHGFDLTVVKLEDEHDEPSIALWNEYCADASDVPGRWRPEMDGWRLAAVYDTEDGPAAAFIRSRT